MAKSGNAASASGSRLGLIAERMVLQRFEAGEQEVQSTMHPPPRIRFSGAKRGEKRPPTLSLRGSGIYQQEYAVFRSLFLTGSSNLWFLEGPMRSIGVIVLILLLSPFALSQTPDSSRPAPSTNGVLSPPQEAQDQILNHVLLGTNFPATPQGQDHAAQSPPHLSVANYSVMLVNPAGGSAVVLMYNPNNQLELVNVSKIKDALSAGYVPVRAVEIAELIASLKEDINRLTTENQHLQAEQATQMSNPSPSAVPSQAERQTQRQTQVETQKAARRQQLIRSWLLLQNMNRPQTHYLNVTVSDCTRYPALCVKK